MGSSYPANGSQDVVMVSTSSLKDRLNKMYKLMRNQMPSEKSAGLFEYLWDLKETALLEGRHCVQVPSNWLDNLETDFMRNQLERSY